MKDARSFGLIAGVGAFTSLTLGFYSHLTAPYLATQGVPPEAIGLFFSVMMGSSAIAVLVGGWLTDHWGSKRTVFIGQLALLVAILVFICQRTPLALLLTAILGGLFAIRDPAITVLLAQGKNKAARFGLYNALATSLAIGAPLIGGILANSWGPLAAYKLALLPAGAAFLLALGIKVPRSNKSAPTKGRRGTYPWGIILIFMLVGLELGLTRPVLGLFMQGKFGQDWLHLGWLTAAGGLAGTLGMLLGGRFGDGFKRTRQVSLGLMVNGFCLFWMLGAGTPVQFILGFSGSNLAAGWILPSLYALSMEVVAEEGRGRFAGITATVLNLGAVAGSAGTGFLFAQLPWLPLAITGLFLVVGGLANPLYMGSNEGRKQRLRDFSLGNLIIWRVTK